jgi:hypothetical protein
VRCEPFHEALSAFADGELDAAGDQAVGDHLARCPECRDRLEQIHALGRRLRVRQVDAVPDLTAAVLAAVPPVRRRPRARRGRMAARPSWPGLRLAPVAVFLLVVGIGLGAGELESRVSHAVPRVTGRAGEASSCPSEGSAVPVGTRDCDRPTLAAPPEQVALHDHSVSRPSLVVPAGTTVEWINADTDAHHLLRRAGDGEISMPLAPGEHDAVTYDAPGTYTYYCAIHPGMQGAVTVLR